MTQTVTVQVDADGVLTLPLGEINANKFVRVTIESMPLDTDREERLRFIQATAGSITDPTFVRHPQGEYEQRDEL